MIQTGSNQSLKLKAAIQVGGNCVTGFNYHDNINTKQEV